MSGPQGSGGPLDGIRVVEASTMAMTPSAAGVLADWGADVVKIEHPRTGDVMRGSIVVGIPLDGWGPGFHLMWDCHNRGKRSVGLDLQQDAGRAALDRLIDGADVFLTNFLPHTREKLRLRPEDVRARNPRTVYALGTGYGTKGPMGGRGGYDLVSFWNRSGIAYETTFPDAPRPAPLPGPAFGDNTTGAILAGGIVAALLKRERTGEAVTVDVSLLASGMWSAQAALVAADLLGTEHLPRVARSEAPNPLILTYRTSDGRDIALSMIHPDRYWAGLCVAVGRPELAEDPRFVDLPTRAAHSAECVALLDEIFAERTLAEWREVLATQPGPWDVVQTPHEVFADEQALANGLVQDVDYGDGRTMRVVASPVHFDDEPPRPGPSPEMGAHTEEVLLELGYSWDEIGDLKDSGVIP